MADASPLPPRRYPRPGPDDADPPPLVDGVHALLCPADDAAALGAAVLRLAANPDLAASLGRGARELAAAFGWAAIAERHAGLYARRG